MRLKNYFPLLTAIFLFMGAVLVILLISLKQNNWNLVYVLDDPYIHMTLAKNFVLHGNYAVNYDSFTSASSSPLWTLLITLCFKIFGIKEFLPLILEIIAAIAALIISDLILRKSNIQPYFRLIILVLLIIATPLIALTFTGLEHILHCILSIIIIYLASKEISSEENSSIFHKFILFISAFLLTSIRYEGAFLLFAAALFLLFRKKYSSAILLLGFGALPIIIVGLISISNGWFFIPNSILLKANAVSATGFFALIRYFHVFFGQSGKSPGIILCIILCFFVLFYHYHHKKKIMTINNVMAILYIFSAIMHLTFANIGWFFRYEAYLVFSGIFVSGIILQEFIISFKRKYFDNSNIINKTALIIAILIGLTPLIYRGQDSTRNLVVSTTNVYEQQYQLGRFLKTYYCGKAVGMNDIGAANFLSDSKIVDLYGLSNLEIAKAKRSHTDSYSVINNILAKSNANIAIIYDEWFLGKENIPTKWIKAGSWTILNNYTCAYSEVSFYARDSVSYNELIYNLKKFSSKLPATIIEKGGYLTVN